MYNPFILREELPHLYEAQINLFKIVYHAIFVYDEKGTSFPYVNGQLLSNETPRSKFLTTLGATK